MPAFEVLNNAGQHIDLMMTDVGWPGMDGSQMATAARKLRPALPILVASGYAESIDVPADTHVIGKPFSIDR